MLDLKRKEKKKKKKERKEICPKVLTRSTKMMANSPLTDCLSFHSILPYTSPLLLCNLSFQLLERDGIFS